jgi:hypothetical protein
MQLNESVKILASNLVTVKRLLVSDEEPDEDNTPVSNLHLWSNWTGLNCTANGSSPCVWLPGNGSNSTTTNGATGRRLFQSDELVASNGKHYITVAEVNEILASSPSGRKLLAANDCMKQEVTLAINTVFLVFNAIGFRGSFNNDGLVNKMSVVISTKGAIGLEKSIEALVNAKGFFTVAKEAVNMADTIFSTVGFGLFLQEIMGMSWWDWSMFALSVAGNVALLISTAGTGFAVKMMLFAIALQGVVNDACGLMTCLDPNQTCHRFI